VTGSASHALCIKGIKSVELPVFGPFISASDLVTTYSSKHTWCFPLSRQRAMTDIVFPPSAEPEEEHPECPSLYRYGSLENKPRTIRLLIVAHDCGIGGDRHYPGYISKSQRNSDKCDGTCCESFNARMPKLSLHEACLDTGPKYEAISYA
jgi:hypothetical protein